MKNPNPNTAVLGLVLLLAVAGAARAQNFGRLFTTPAERVQLDAARYAEPEQEPQQDRQAPQAPKPDPVKVFSFKMDGMVVRGSGPNTAWIDGKRVPHKGAIRQGVSINPDLVEDGGIVVRLLNSGRDLRIKPGQAFDSERARVMDPVTQPGNTAAAAPPR